MMRIMERNADFFRKGRGRFYTEIRQYKYIGKVERVKRESWEKYFKDRDIEVIGKWHYYYLRSDAGSVWYRFDEYGKEHWYVVGYDKTKGERGGHSKVYYEVSRGDAVRLLKWRYRDWRG